MKRRRFPRAPAVALGGAASLAVLAVVSAWALGWWIDYSEEPRASDMIVVLSGDLARPFHAADLFREGYAPEVWISRPAGGPQDALLRQVGIAVQSQQELSREILLRRGVPSGRIHLYGEDAVSTVDEALALKAAVDTRGKRLLVVTSRFHARRSGIIFRRILTGASVRVTATPYEPFTRRWWTDRKSIDFVMLEPVKMLWFWLGGRFVSRPSR